LRGIHTPVLPAKTVSQQWNMDDFFREKIYPCLRKYTQKMAGLCLNEWVLA